MFDRIEVDVIHVRRVVLVVANGVLPEASLPDPAFAVGAAHAGQPLRLRQTAHEAGFDQSPAGGEVIVARWQGPYRVKMIRKHHPGIDGEGPGLPHAAHRFAQEFDPVVEQCVAAPLQQVNREKIAAAGNTIAMEIGHQKTPVPERVYPIGLIRRNTPSAIPTYGVGLLSAARQT